MDKNIVYFVEACQIGEGNIEDFYKLLEALDIEKIKKAKGRELAQYCDLFIQGGELLSDKLF